MRSIDRFALSFSPILLRVAIGVTFLWAGAGKLFYKVELTDAQRAVITQLETGAATPSETVIDDATPADVPADTTPVEPLPEPDASDLPADTPAADPPSEEDDDGERPVLRSLTDPSASALGTGYTLTLAQDTTPAAPAPDATDDDEAGELITDTFGEAPADIDPGDTPAEFVGSNPQKERFLAHVALTIHDAAHPEKGSPRLPGFIATHALKLAWAVAIIEFTGGICVLLGFLTRVWAFAITGVIAGAFWTTELGPAVMGGLDQTFLGFLPPLWPFDPGAGMHFFWTLGLTLSAFALVFLGAGGLSVDRFLFGHPLNTLEVYTPDEDAKD